MTDTTHYTTPDHLATQRISAPRIAGTAAAFTPHRYTQDQVTAELTDVAPPGFERFTHTSGVESRNLAVPLARYPELNGFTETNTAYVEVATDLAAQAIRAALEAAHLEPTDVDAIISVSSTGIAVPTIDARLAGRVGFRPDIKRNPMFGLGCVAGAAGLARLHDYLRGYPGDVAVLVSVELCSLTLQRDDASIPALIGVCLFGDGAAAVVGTGADRAPAYATARPGPTVLATRSRLFDDTIDVMGWNVSSSGFQLVMSRDVPRMADDYLRGEVDAFLADYGLTTADVSTWICHPGGPKVIDAIRNALELSPAALAHSADSMREHGNISSASVLDVLRRTMLEPPAPGELGVLLAMGPGFCFELLLLSW